MTEKAPHPARYPLFFAALVAVAGVSAAEWGTGWGLLSVFVCGGLGWAFLSWRMGLAWLLLGSLAVAGFAWRVESRNVAERELLGSAAGERQGQVLRDGRGSERFWSAPVILGSGQTVVWEGRGEVPVAGAWVQGNGHFAPLPTMRNPGEFDQAAWLSNQGVAAIFQTNGFHGRISTGKWATLGARLRRGFRAAVTDGLEENSQAAAVIRAVVIGESPPDAEELVAAFRNSGQLHAFSVSGMHVAMMAAIAWWGLKILGMPRRWAVAILLPLIFGYSWITGNSPPAVRAAWMATVFLGAFVTRRRPDLLNALGAVLLAAILWDGQLLAQPGVQLSYGVVAAIALGMRPAQRIFAWIARPGLYLPESMMTRGQRIWLRFRQSVAQSLGVSLAAGIGSAPLTAWHFGMITPISIVAGVCFAPFVFALLGMALLATVLALILPPAAKAVNRANGHIADACVATVKSFAAIPGGHFRTQGSRPASLLIYDLEHGAGSACFSDGRGGGALIDCGDVYGFKRRIAPSLRRLGIDPDRVVLTHPDGGHLGGGAAVWRNFPIAQVLLPVENSRSRGYQSWAVDAPAAGVKRLLARDFHQLPMPDGAQLEVVYFPTSANDRALADDRVALYRLHWRGWKILFTSDAGMGTELEILDAHIDVAADLIIAGKHRRDATLCDRFLDAVHPQAIIATHAELPAAEKIRPETLAYWRSRGIQPFSQAVTGGVAITHGDAGTLILQGFADHSRVVLQPKKIMAD